MITSVLGYRPFTKRIPIIKKCFDEMVAKKSLPHDAKFERLEWLEEVLTPGRLIIRVTRTIRRYDIISYDLSIGLAMGGLAAVWDYDGFIVNAQRIQSQHQDWNGVWISHIFYHEKDTDFRVPDDFLIRARLPVKGNPLVCEFFVTRREIHEEVIVNHELRAAMLSSKLYCERILNHRSIA